MVAISNQELGLCAKGQGDLGDLCVDELWMQEEVEHEDHEEHEGDELPGGGRTLLP